MEPKLLVQTEELLVYDKPPGLSSVRLPGERGSPSVVDFLLTQFPEQARVGEKSDEDAGALYRLDRETSGVLIFARTDEAHAHYRALWKTDLVSKRYVALAAESPSLRAGARILYPIGRSAKVRGKSVAVTTPQDMRSLKGSAHRSVTILEDVSAHESQKGIARVGIRIETGAPHQIRCHLSAIGAPILGDALYGGAEAERLFLHCATVELPLRDETDGTLRFEAPAPF